MGLPTYVGRKINSKLEKQMKTKHKIMVVKIKKKKGKKIQRSNFRET